MQLEQIMAKEPLLLQAPRRTYSPNDLNYLSVTRFYSDSKESNIILNATLRSLKLQEGGKGLPLLRLDYNADPDGSKPEKHLHYGNSYLGRSGNEATEILAQVIVENPAISLGPVFSSEPSSLRQFSSEGIPVFNPCIDGS